MDGAAVVVVIIQYRNALRCNSRELVAMHAVRQFTQVKLAIHYFEKCIDASSSRRREGAYKRYVTERQRRNATHIHTS